MGTKKVDIHKAKKGHYQSALTLNHLKNPPLNLSVVKGIPWGDETVDIYFKPFPADMPIRLQDPNLTASEQLAISLEIVACSVVDPSTGNPLMSLDEWRKMPFDMVNVISGALVGIQFEEDGEEELTEDNKDDDNENPIQGEPDSGITVG